MLFDTPQKLDRRRKYYLVLDSETATLPFITDFAPEFRKKLSIANPLIYNIGWKILDARGREYCRKSFLISEIFCVPNIFNTAYYAEKRPVYIEALDNGEIKLIDWRSCAAEFSSDLFKVDAIGAYNAAFDLKKAIKFTDEYINAFYSNNFNEWYAKQKEKCAFIIEGKPYKKSKDYKPNNSTFRFGENEKPVFDIWVLTCKHILNCDEFRNFCLENGYITASGKYYSTTVETAYRFINQNSEFVEAHTAIEDTDAEAELLLKVLKKRSNMQYGIEAFPFRIVGKIEKER